MSDPGLLDKLQRIVLADAKLRLLLNPTEADHQHLHEAIEAAFKRLKSEDTAETETEKDIQTITRFAQAILKREWQRVKRGV
jgi:hypothetical protein